MEVGIIKLSIRSKEQDVLRFIKELKQFLGATEFNIDRDLTIIKSKKLKERALFSTPYTLVDLEYDAGDMVNRLKELTIKEYSETLIDKDDLNPPLLFVFGKDINGRLVYIKLKMKGERSRHVLCVSFHYAERAMSFPFA